ncbi:MAG: hypothetical protein WAT39_19410, partial [Planctomycetota bacterium]
SAFAAADGDRDGFLALPDLQAALAAAGGNETPGGATAFLLGVLIAIHADERPGHVRLAAALAIGDAIHPERLMAHERHPPPGYLDDLAPNVDLVGGTAIVKPRPVPMTAERLREVEARWRRKYREGEWPQGR